MIDVLLSFILFLSFSSLSLLLSLFKSLWISISWDSFSFESSINVPSAFSFFFPFFFPFPLLLPRVNKSKSLFSLLLIASDLSLILISSPFFLFLSFLSLSLLFLGSFSFWSSINFLSAFLFFSPFFFPFPLLLPWVNKSEPLFSSLSITSDLSLILISFISFISPSLEYVVSISNLLFWLLGELEFFSLFFCCVDFSFDSFWIFNGSFSS